MNDVERDLVVIDVEVNDALRRRKKHPDPVSQAGISVTIDALLDERYALSPVKSYSLDDVLFAAKLKLNN